MEYYQLSFCCWFLLNPIMVRDLLWMISILLTVFRFVLSFKPSSVFVNVPWGFERNVYSAIWKRNILDMLIRLGCLIVLFNFSISLLVFYPVFAITCYYLFSHFCFQLYFVCMLRLYCYVHTLFYDCYVPLMNLSIFLYVILLFYLGDIFYPELYFFWH